VPSSQVGVVGVRILGLAPPEAAQRIGENPEANLLGHGGTELLLKPEEAGGLALVGLRPDPLLIANSNQRGRDPQPSALGPDRARDQEVDGKLLADLGKAPSRAPVPQGATLDA